jgi:hypothetical protein
MSATKALAALFLLCSAASAQDYNVGTYRPRTAGGGGGGGTPTFVQGKMCQEGTPDGAVQCSFDSSVTTGNMIIVFTANYEDGATTTGSAVTDNKGNGTYTNSPFIGNVNSGVSISHVIAATAGSSFQVTSTPTGTGNNYTKIYISEWDAVASGAALDSEGLASSTDDTSAETATVTPGGGSNILYVAMTMEPSDTLSSCTQGGGWTSLAQSCTTSTTVGLAAAYVVGSGDKTTTFTLSSSQDWTSAIAAFAAE